MKRYLIFGTIGPLVGGLLLLFTTSYLTGYWTHTDLMEVQKFFLVMFRSLQYSYLFGLLPSLMIAAIDEIFCHIRGIKAPLRMLIVGALAFVLTGFMYANRGADAGVVQLVLYGMVGLVPTMLSSWLVSKFCKPVIPEATPAGV